MCKCISKVISLFTYLWRTICSTFVKKHLYTKDVDGDAINEIVIDINGKSDYISEENNIKEE